jgi:hypothetical protein
LDDSNARANIKEFLLEIADVEQNRNRTENARLMRAKANSL